MKDALLIGRFQPLHNGHKHAIEDADEEYNVIIGIGSANQGRTKHNPLHAREREQLIESCFPDLEHRQIPDFEDDDTWLNYLQNNLSFDLVISGNDWVTGLCADRNIQTEPPSFFKPEVYRGTKIRRRIVREERWRHCVPDCSERALEDLGFESIIHQVETLGQGDA